jgi:signal transduction histidine kinase
MLWYNGFWNERADGLYRRQRLGFIAVLLLGLAGLAVVVTYANPFAGQLSLLPVRFFVERLGGLTLLMGGYALYLLLCMGLSLDALLRPGPTAREMGELARKRARRWLVVATVLFLVVSLLIITVLLWMLFNVRQGGIYYITDGVLVGLERFDLLISLLLALGVSVLGQAVVSYEIFTGKSLPRGGLRLQWQRTLLLAAGYGGLLGAALTLVSRPVYSVLLSLLLLVAFLVLVNWRAFAEREQYMAQLRPFVAGRDLYDNLLLAPAAPTEVDVHTPFYALCCDLLGARQAVLVPWGPLAPLAGAPLVYPQPREIDLPPLHELTARFPSPQKLRVAVDGDRYAGAVWALALWSERGVSGFLLLGEKVDGGLYTQEEMEIARASSERLLATRAAAEMGRRLLSLQRQQLAESQVLDRRTRRTLHDEVLPQVHAALLALGGRPETEEVTAQLTAVHRQISDLLHDIPPAITPAVARLGVLKALRQAIEEELGRAFDHVAWEVPVAVAEQARTLPALTAEVLFYAAREAIRNAARHGRVKGQPLQLRVSAFWAASGLELIVEDDGAGVASGSDGGQGLALHSTMMAVVGGSLATESVPGEYTRVRLSLPDGWPGTVERDSDL